MSISFENKVALVTGAARGLGREHALELARRGARLVVNDFGGAVDGQSASETAVEQVASEIRTLGAEVIADSGSVSQPEDAEAMVKKAVDAWGRVDILINNAGILRDKSFAKISAEEFEGVIAVHLLGSFYCTRAAWPFMREQAYGRIVMTSSPSGLYGNFGQTNYGAAKLGLVGFMNSLKIEGAKYNIHTNAIAPVATTRMTESLMPEPVLKKMKPELVTSGVVFLCSEQAPNGVILQAAGGTFSVAAVVENKGVDLGEDASAEDVAEHFDQISDISQVKPRSGLSL